MSPVYHFVRSYHSLHHCHYTFAQLAGCQNDDGSGNVGAIPGFCPSLNNWLGMPTKCDSLTQTGDKINDKLAQFEVWDKYCRLGQMV